MELRDFRKVNETAGFEAGDEYLRSLARNIQGRIRTNDILCRFAADRFAFVFPETDPRQFSAIEKKLRASLEAVTYKVGEESRTLDAIITSALFPTEGTNSAELLRLLVTRAQEDRQRAAIASV
jgi:diguanylate cyclase (GGDEF)-like protein